MVGIYNWYEVTLKLFDQPSKLIASDSTNTTFKNTASFESLY